MVLDCVIVRNDHSISDEKVIDIKEQNLEATIGNKDETKESNLESEKEKIESSGDVMFSINNIDEQLFKRINGLSYKENYRVKLDDLKYITVSYWGFDDKEHRGELIVHKEVAEEVVKIFEELYNVKFPIYNITLIDDYDAVDDLSMSANNTSAFNYRTIAGTDNLSNHAYGLAIDINPVQNPYVTNNKVLPEESVEYLDRTDIRKGMIVEGDDCYTVFKKYGWEWGGDWNSYKDYQHFEKKIEGINN